MRLRPLLIVALIIVLLLALLWFGQRRLIYFPDTTTPPAAATLFPGGRDLTLLTDDGLRLGAWLIPPHSDTTSPTPQSRSADRGITVLVANGNGGNRLGRVPLAKALAAQGFSVLLFDYRGYGGNPGSPTERGLALDARAARGAITGPVIYFGESLGAAVAAELATEHSPAGLVLRSPFTDLAAAGSEHYPLLPVRLLLRDRYPVTSHIATVTVPTVVIIGTADSIVPPEQSREVARRAAGPVTTIEVTGADHNDASLQDGAELIAAVVALADRLAV